MNSFNTLHIDQPQESFNDLGGGQAALAEPCRFECGHKNAVRILAELPLAPSKKTKILLHLPHWFSGSAISSLLALPGVVGILITASPKQYGLKEPAGVFFHENIDAPLPANLPEGRYIISFHPKGLPLAVDTLRAKGYSKGFYRFLEEWRGEPLFRSVLRLRYERWRAALPQKLKHALPPAGLFCAACPSWPAKFSQKLEKLLDKGCLKCAPAPGRIVMVNSTLRNGGAERQLLTVIAALQKQNFNDIRVLCRKMYDTPDNRFHLQCLLEENIPVHELGEYDEVAEEPPILESADLRDSLRFLPHHLSNETLLFTKAFYSLRPQIAHIWMDNAPAVLGALLSGVPRIILSLRSLSLATHAKIYLPALPLRTDLRTPYDKSLHPIYSVLLRDKRVTICSNSQAGRKDYSRWLGFPEQEIKVIHNGIDPKLWKRPADHAVNEFKHILGIPANVPVIGSLFRFSTTKDPELWLQCAAKVAQRIKDSVFVIFGSGAERENMLALARNLGLESRLYLPGITHQVALALSMMQVVVLTSRIESTPNVLIEAQLLGVPVVATRVGGVPETVMQGSTGWLVEHGDIDALAERTAYILQDEQWQKRARLVSPVFIQRQFSKDIMLKKLAELYSISTPAHRV